MEGKAWNVVATVCAVVLAIGLVPVGSAFPIEGSASKAMTQGAANAIVQSAAAAESQGALVPGGFSRGEAADYPETADDCIIVVYKELASDVGAGLSTQAVEVAVPGATEELLTADAGEGVGAATVAELPENVSVDEAIAAAEANPAVAYAQRNHRYYLPEDAAVMEGGAGQVGEASEAGDAGGGAGSDAGESSETGDAAASDPASPEPATLVNDPAALVAEDTKTQPNQWWLYDIGAFDAWQYARAEGEVTVAVFDTGIAFEHEDLSDNVLADYAYDAYHRQKLTESPTSDEFGHGTHVAGIVAGVANNETGIAGVSFNAKILPVCVFHQGSDFMGRPKAIADDATIIRAYDYLQSDPDGDGRTVAEETNTRVVNMSLGGYEGEDDLLEAKIEQAQAAGILSVAAAGNDGTTQASYPSDYDAVMSVTALNSDGTIAYFSDHNASKDIAAPGTQIYSTWWSGGYEWEDGTSMAAPVVSGCAALLWAYYPGLSVNQVKEALYSTADDLGSVGFDVYFGHGRVNPAAALRSLGLVMVTPERADMACATTQRLSAAADFDTGAHSWEWSVDDPSLAYVADDGTLYALAPGTVRVTVRDANDEVVHGSCEIEVRALELPGSVVATPSGASRTVNIQWNATEGASLYRIERSGEQAGPYAAIAEVEVEDSGGEDGTAALYADNTVEAGARYWYRVVPVGMMSLPDREEPLVIDGVASLPSSALFIDKAQLRAAMVRANALLRDGSARLSEDGRADVDGNPVYEDEQWVSPAVRDRLAATYAEASACYMDTAADQLEIDAQAATLGGAADDYEAAKEAGLVSRSGTADESDGSGANGQPNQSDADSQADGRADGAQVSSSGGFAMHRLYNPNSGEHFYTAEVDERDMLVRVGWSYEGTGWTAPKASALPVYRLYNPNAGDHHYTTSVRERDWLKGVGWNYEGVGWFSDEAQGQALYRLYNPNAQAGAHHYTTSTAERDDLARLGWRYEEIGWYGL